MHVIQKIAQLFLVHEITKGSLLLRKLSCHHFNQMLWGGLEHLVEMRGKILNFLVTEVVVQPFTLLCV